MWHSQACGTFLPSPHQHYPLYVMPQRNQTKKVSNEAHIQTAIQAIQKDATLKPRRAAAIFGVSENTLRRRLAGTPSRRDYMPKTMALRGSEEVAIVRHVINMVDKGYPPRLANVEDMANSLLTSRLQKPVGKNWSANFVKRRPELKVKFNRKYDYKRALCEDPIIIRGWFELVESTKAKYGIQDEDTYNFDETGFMMGVISIGVVVIVVEY